MQVVNRRQAAQESLAKLRNALKSRKKLKSAMAVLGEARDVFHWSRLPNRVAQGNLVNMEGCINTGLGWFGDPFWCEADDNLGFQVHQPGHPPCRAERLSWGQKGVFAMAFRYSVGTLFGADVGIMVLDEPTGWMDGENVEFFRVALQKLAVEVRGKRQLIVITHAEQLISSFDQVIQITADHQVLS
jgi:hypothetical protein